MEQKLKHLELIQGVISRMAHNSFLLKGWSVVLVSALFALSARDANRAFILLAYFPAAIFWLLDAYFLWQERLFRRLYDDVRQKDADDVEFSMDTSSVSGQTWDTTWHGALLSKTLLVFHAGILVTIVVVLIVASWQK